MEGANRQSLITGSVCAMCGETAYSTRGTSLDVRPPGPRSGHYLVTSVVLNNNNNNRRLVTLAEHTSDRAVFRW